MAITANNSGSNRRDCLRMYTPAANIFSSSITIPSEVILYIHNHNYTRKSKDVQESVELGPPTAWASSLCTLEKCCPTFSTGSEAQSTTGWLHELNWVGDLRSPTQRVVSALQVLLYICGGEVALFLLHDKKWKYIRHSNISTCRILTSKRKLLLS